METLLITGAEGMVANHFAALYGDRYNIRFLSRRPIGANTYFWDPETECIDPEAVMGVDHILHLAGARISRHRWTARYKDEILTSRAGGTALIGTALMENNVKVKTFITASAVGYYGLDREDVVMTETSSSGRGFIPYVCRAWEEEALILHSENLAERVVVARMGLVLCHYAGALPRMAFGAKYGIAPVLGSGEQYVSWIHINDLCRMYHFMMQCGHVSGIYNAVAPEQVTYREISHALAEVQAGRVYELWIPSCAVRYIYDDAAEILLKGVRVSSDKIVRAGFEFKHPALYEAIESILIP